jgi:hypothetical protein
MRQMPARTRFLGFGVFCLLLAIVAAVTASWIPLAILVIVGAVFVGRGLTMNTP